MGIELTDTHVKVCEVTLASKEKAKLHAYISQELPAGLIEDGKVHDWALLEQKMKEALVSNKFGSKIAHFAIPSQMVMVRSLKLPDLANMELRKLIQFEMNNNFSLAFEDPYYDFVKLPSQDVRQEDSETGGSKPLCEVMVIAAPSQTLRQYRALLESAGLQPASFEIAPFSLLRLMEHGDLLSHDVQILVNVNERHCEISVICEGYMQITRHVEITFASIMKEGAESGNEWLTSFANPEQTFLNGALDLIAEIDRLMNFYNYTLNNGRKKWHNVWMTGDLKGMDKLRDLMVENMDQQVNLMTWSDLDINAESAYPRADELAIPLGLALRGRS